MIPVALKFAGVKLSLMTREEFKEYLIQSLYEKQTFRVVTLDEKKLFLSFFNKELRQTIRNAEVVLSSSQTVNWAARMLTKKTFPVLMPVTLFLDTMRIADEMNYTIFLFGGSRKVNIATWNRIHRSFPKARILGKYRWGAKKQELENVLTTIRKSSPQIFFASLGSSAKQEKWLNSQKDILNHSIVMGVDNTFKIISGEQHVPPIWIQEKGWNGLYHSIRNPLNLFRLFRLLTIVIVTLYRKLSKKPD